MAGDSYSQDGYGQPDTSNGTPDWWTINTPPANPGLLPPAVDPATGPNTGWSASTGLYNPDRAMLDAQPPPTPTFDNQTWGGPVSPYGGSPYPTFTPPPLPDYLQKGFALPSATELTSSPGYLARFNQGQQARQRSAASHGTILNGGTQVALDRAGQEFASNEYGNLVNQKLNERQQQSSDWLNLAYGPAWQQNQAAVNQYGQMYGQYKDLINNNRNSQSDYWQQQLDLLKLAQSSAAAGNPGTGA